MSFSSSSECDCYSCQYGTSYQPAYTPFYPTMGQPMVYYAQVPSTRTPRSRERRKDKPNCFVKAFRWYTQEHIPHQNQQMIDSPRPNPDVVGFAGWLDTKYEQFLHETDQGYHVKLTQTSMIETERIINRDVNHPCTTKRFARMRSPWKKRPCCPNNNEEGDVLVVPNKSLVYILEPKDLPHPLSACCYPTPTSCCSSKRITKSQSATDFPKGKDALTFDIAHPQEGAKIKGKLSEDVITKNAKIDDTSVNCNDIECQCCVELATKDDAQTQYDDFTSPKTLVASDSNPLASTMNKESVVTASSKLEAVESCSSPKVLSQAVVDETPVTDSKPEPTHSLPLKHLVSSLKSDVRETSPETKIDPPRPKNIVLQQCTKMTPSSLCPCVGCTPLIIQTPETPRPMLRNRNYLNNVSCQCYEEPIAQNQYCMQCICSTNYSKGIMYCNNCGNEIPNQQAVKICQPPLIGQKLQPIEPKCSLCPSKVQCPAAVECKPTSTCSCMLLVNDAAQTSDHSLCIENESIHGYPLFMRIICADKLTDEDCVCQKKLCV